jgi:Ras-related protein Rab-1A
MTSTDLQQNISPDKQYDLIFKVLLIGNSGVGKSSLFLRFVDDIWEDNFVPTIGVDFKIKTLIIEEKKIKLQIWDTAGQDRFRTIVSSYYRGAHGILLIFDLTDIESFKSLNNWLIEIERNANKNVIKVLIGNKCDLTEERKVSVQEVNEFAEINGMKYVETSAKDNINVIDAFSTLGMELIAASQDNHQIGQVKEMKKIILNDNMDLNKKKKNNDRCCNNNKK